MTTLDRETFLRMLTNEVRYAVGWKDTYHWEYTRAYTKGRLSGLAFAGLITEVITPEEHRHIYRIIAMLE